jgi:hypothetical protein
LNRFLGARQEGLLLTSSLLCSSFEPAAVIGGGGGDNSSAGDGVLESEVYSVVVGDRSSLPVLFSRHRPPAVAVTCTVRSLSPLPEVSAAFSASGRSQGPPSRLGSMDFRLFFRKVAILEETTASQACN